MNLLMKYLPNHSGHVERIQYFVDEKKLEIVFFDQPEEFNPILKLVFIDVYELTEQQLDGSDPNSIELVIGLDYWNDGYCLHTDLREFNFKAREVLAVAINT